MDDKTKTSFWKPAFTYGGIMAAVSIFLSLVFYFTSLYLKTWASFGSFAVTLVVLFFCMFNYRKEYLGGFGSFGKMFLMAFVSGMISLVIGLAFGFLMQNVLFPDMQEAVRLAAEERILNNSRIPESMVDDMIDRIDKNMQPGRQMMMGLIGGTVFQALISLIVAAIVKKEEPVAQV